MYLALIYLTTSSTSGKTLTGHQSAGTVGYKDARYQHKLL